MTTVQPKDQSCSRMSVDLKWAFGNVRASPTTLYLVTSPYSGTELAYIITKGPSCRTAWPPLAWASSGRIRPAPHEQGHASGVRNLPHPF